LNALPNFNPELTKLLPIFWTKIILKITLAPGVDFVKQFRPDFFLPNLAILEVIFGSDLIISKL
jgi:hypothetical protein